MADILITFNLRDIEIMGGLAVKVDYGRRKKTKTEARKRQMNILARFWSGEEKGSVGVFLKKNNYDALTEDFDVIEGEDESGHKTFSYFHKVNGELVATHIIWSYDDEYVYEGYEMVEFTEYGEEVLQAKLRPVLEGLLKAWEG